MARKLKSDKVLFLATLLLVCSSVVMVYSASAALAMNRFNQPVLLPDEAGHVGRPRAGRHDHRDALRLPQLSRAVVHLDVARHRDVRACRRTLQRANQRQPEMVRHWRVWRAAIGAGEAQRHLLYSRAARAADGSHRRHEVCAGAHRRRGGRPGRPDPSRARSGYVDDAADDRRRHGVRRRPELSLRRRRHPLRPSGCRISFSWARHTAAAG